MQNQWTNCGGPARGTPPSFSTYFPHMFSNIYIYIYIYSPIRPVHGSPVTKQGASGRRTAWPRCLTSHSQCVHWVAQWSLRLDKASGHSEPCRNQKKCVAHLREMTVRSLVQDHRGRGDGAGKRCLKQKPSLPNAPWGPMVQKP